MATHTAEQCYRDKTIVIVGGAGGLGQAFAHQCLTYTSRVVLLGRHLDKLEAVSQEIPANQCFHLDISDETTIKTVIDEIEAVIGPIDISFNLSGYDVFKYTQDMTSEDIIKTCRVNFEGPVMYTHYLLSKMLPRQAGILANVNAFSNGLVPFPFYTLDSASRAGIASYYRALRREITDTYPQIRFVNFSPPLTDTVTTRSDITARVYSILSMKSHDPEEVVSRVLREISQGNDELMALDGRVLFWIETISQRLGNLVFFNQFCKASHQVLGGAGNQ